MNGQNYEKPRRSRLFNAVLFLFVLIELVVCIGSFGVKRDALNYGIEYEKSPLVLKKAVITNRDDIRENFDIYDEEDTLYELCLTYENIAVYSSRYNNRLDIRTGDRGYYISAVYPADITSIGRQSIYNQVIPAGKTGSIILYIAAPADAGSIQLSEEEEKLLQKGADLTLTLPAQVSERDTWTAD